MNIYHNRQHAGIILAQALSAYANQKNLLILALPRGGVPVAYEVAKSLHAPLDVFIVRKVGAPGHSELALGAIAMGNRGNIEIFNEELINHLHMSVTALEPIIHAEQQELKRREQLYRDNKPFPLLTDKIVILIDDGIATGASMRAAIKALRQLQPQQLIVAVPVAEKIVCDAIAATVDTFICPLQPDDLNAVGSWYEDFTQTEDTEVRDLLQRANRKMHLF
ncbi:MAG TPA: phosphoribosyltransferase [Gammaproteobacteria bacterium]|jgi:predicted phosphoribosyltransferase|nr:phosphoribosyltransferase [Gammaproteobacteria bacterium]